MPILQEQFYNHWEDEGTDSIPAPFDQEMRPGQVIQY